MSVNALKDFKNKVSEALFRFPVSALFALVFYIIVADLFEIKVGSKVITLLSIFGYFWFISLQIMAESFQWRLIYTYVIGVTLFIAISMVSYKYNSYGFLIVSVVSIFVAPFLNKKSNSMQLWCFNDRLWRHIGFTILLAIVAIIMLSVVIYSLDFLFSIKYIDPYSCCFFIAALMSPIIMISGIPKEMDSSALLPNFIQKILSYIILPSLFFYAFVLHVYIIKLMISWDLPKGGVVYLVSTFGFAGIISYFVSYPLHETRGIIGLFSKSFFKILIAPLGLFSVAIFVRIKEYGITENRVLVLLCLAWFVSIVAFSFTKYKKEAPRMMLLSLVIFFDNSSFTSLELIYLENRLILHRYVDVHNFHVFLEPQ